MNQGGQQTGQVASDPSTTDLEKRSDLPVGSLPVDADRQTEHENGDCSPAKFEPQTPSQVIATEEGSHIDRRTEQEGENVTCSFLMGFLLSLLLGLFVFCFLCCSDAVGLRGRATKFFIAGGILGNIVASIVVCVLYVIFGVIIIP